MTKLIAFFLQNDITDFNENMGELMGGVIFVLFIVLLIGWAISKNRKSAK